jgi:threonine dehydratase
MPEPLLPGLADIEGARERLAGLALRTPMLRLDVDAPCEIWLKLENLQPIGSFKIRGAGNALALAPSERLALGVSTASAGNMAQGVGFVCRRRGLGFTCHVPDHAPRTKLEAIERLGGRLRKLPFADWFRLLVEGGPADEPGFFVHPVSDPAVMAGNATIGLEILEELPDVDTVVAPFGGGGLSCGLAAALRARGSSARVLAAEVSTAAPVAASLAAGEPVEVDYRPSFVDGSGSGGLLPAMWPLVVELLAGSVVVSLDEVAAAIRLLAERARVIAEGAGALPVAAALGGGAGGGRVCCVVSGGNIDAAKLAPILEGTTPGGPAGS